MFLDPANGGSVAGSGKYQKAKRVEIYATPNNCCHFTSWTDAQGNIISTEPNYEIVLIKDSILTANFVRDSFDLVLKANPTNGGSAVISGRYACGEKIQIEAIANNKYKFINWTEKSGTIISSKTIDSITIIKDSVLIANFEKNVVLQPDTFNLILKSNPVAGGSTIGSGKYEKGQTARIEAIANNEYLFINWTDEQGNVISTKFIDSVTIIKDSVLIANFEKNVIPEPDTFNLTLLPEPANGGSVIGSGRYEEGTKVSITATPNDCYHFTSWTDAQGNIISTEPNYEIILIKDSILTANFVSDSFNLTLLPEPVEGGSAAISGRYACGDKIQIEAIANNEYLFINWTDEQGNIISADAIDSVTIIKDSVLVVNFEKNVIPQPDTFNLTLLSEPIEGGSVIGSGRYEEGTKVSITATPNDCYHFTSWTDAQGNIISTEPNYEIILIKDSILTANFVRDSFSLMLLPEPVEGGSAAISGRYACGDKIEIKAIANNEYFFINWTDEAGNVISTSAIDSVTIIKDSVLVANFKAIPMPSATFIIRASEHKLVSPNAANYEIPIYITADKDVAASNLYIDKLVIEMDRNIYYPTNATSTIANNMRNTTLTNIPLPELVEGKEALLCTIKGDVLLGDIDSSGIVINEVNFSDNMKLEQLDTINGYITLDICREGGERLIMQGNVPYVHVLVNPAKSTLYVRCQTLEAGGHSLDIVDVPGNSATVKTWQVNLSDERLYECEIDISQYSEGAYTIIMHTPTKDYTAGFVVAE